MATNRRLEQTGKRRRAGKPRHFAAATLVSGDEWSYNAATLKSDTSQNDDPARR